MKKITYEFVDFIPEVILDDIIFISIECRTAVHKCFCGCQTEVVTPLSPTDWKIIFDGETISLHPSIGNWSFPCKSHYWVKENSILWAPKWSSRQIKKGRVLNIKAKEKQYTSNELNLEVKTTKNTTSHLSLWNKIKNIFTF